MSPRTKPVSPDAIHCEIVSPTAAYAAALAILFLFLSVLRCPHSFALTASR